jgi:methylenetetrahydrofolate--tRNA-(uracil-5-)-methyltransferase
MDEATPCVTVVGAGLAGSEAALVLARQGITVQLLEMRPRVMTPAHTSGRAAELVCSNSLRSNAQQSAPGLLKQELRDLHSPLIAAADAHAVAAGSALAVDRERFSRHIDHALQTNPRITRHTREVTSLDPHTTTPTIIATGPLTGQGLTRWLQQMLGSRHLHFYDAIAPIVDGDTIDMEIAFFGARRMEGARDYINCPFSKAQFDAFYNALTEADTVQARSFEDARYFEACLPIEVIAGRGHQALAFGPMRPVGLRDPRTGARPYAVCQLRREDREGGSYNLVGCQTRLTYTDQARVFRMIPGLENAHFLRYGSMHRNTYIDAPQHVTPQLFFSHMPHIYIAGQLCGNEGYTESIATGHLTARSVYAALHGLRFTPPPDTTALGALHRHVTASGAAQYTPGNVNFGLLPPLVGQGGKKIPKKEKKRRICMRAREDFEQWLRREGL